jgi:hypothetical protein
VQSVPPATAKQHLQTAAGLGLAAILATIVYRRRW